MMILTSKNNPLIKETAGLKEKKNRRELGAFLVEGVKMARECLKSGLEIEKIFVAENFNGENFDESKTVVVSQDVLRYLSDEKTPQGVVCRVKIPVEKLEKPQGRCLLLDGIADPGNMGAIIRTANAAGYKEVYLTKECTDPYSPKSVRASMSGIFFTKIYMATREEILSVFDGVEIFVADMNGENVFNFVPPEKFALVIGNEANGISEQVFKLATRTLKIPMQSTQESLNASVAAGISMYLLAKDEFINE
ncbi:MAG: RNA methyltransferase [Clostridiales bacterium]|nr:RNA methyltransferase [Clostridiales bacterium]